MPTPQSVENVPLTGEKVSTLQYVEARLHALQELVQTQIADADLRYSQRFEASQEALAAAMMAAEKAIQAALTGAAQAVLKAEMANERRFEGVNEFRKTLSDQTASFIPRAEAAARFDSLGEKMDALSSRLDKSEGKGLGQAALWGIVVSVIAVAGTVAGLMVLFTK